MYSTFKVDPLPHSGTNSKRKARQHSTRISASPLLPGLASNLGVIVRWKKMPHKRGQTLLLSLFTPLSSFVSHCNASRKLRPRCYISSILFLKHSFFTPFYFSITFISRLRRKQKFKLSIPTARFILGLFFFCCSHIFIPSSGSFPRLPRMDGKP